MTMGRIKQIVPAEIEARSFAIIDQEFESRTSMDKNGIDPAHYQIIRRVIHATGDFSFAQSLVIHEQAVPSAIEAIRGGQDIYMDVTMGYSGVSSSILARFGGKVRCHINDPEIAEQAKASARTRTETALQKLGDKGAGIIGVGNAPTALIAAMEMIEAGRLAPSLLVGVPVGFVNAEESKDLLLTKTYPFITNRGRKGGSPVAVAIINALLRLAIQ